MNETPATISKWALETFGSDGNDMSVALRAHREMSELLEAINKGKSQNDIAEEAADVIIVLCRIFDRCGTTMQEALNKKMAINRKRKWVMDGSGTGHHVHVDENLTAEQIESLYRRGPGPLPPIRYGVGQATSYAEGMLYNGNS